jgi:ubiquinone/menaquinone biosynthesis C-methylase UbiE
MNRSHAELTSWGLQRIQVDRRDVVLDVGCGGGMTVQMLSKMADMGKVYGVDYAPASVAASRACNDAAIKSGRAAIVSASVSCLPFPNDYFDLVTAVETHYYWPDHTGDMREICRVLKPGGSLMIIAETYRGDSSWFPSQLAMKPLGGACLSPDEHRALFAGAGFDDIQLSLEPARGWICVTGRRPSKP